MNRCQRKRMFGWHFTAKTLRNGAPLPKVGKWERFTGKCTLYQCGLHLGVTPWDALQFSPGEFLRLVEYAKAKESRLGVIVCARRRTIAQIDASELLSYFARLQAIYCLDKWKSELPRIVLDYLFTGNEVARDAACQAAREAGRKAMRIGATSTWVASVATSLAASAAPHAAARDSAWAAANPNADAEFNALVYECFQGPMRKTGFNPFARR